MSGDIPQFVQLTKSPRATVNVSTSGRPGQVYITPVASAVRPKTIVDKAFIRAVSAGGKKTDFKMFTLRNIDTQRLKTCEHLKTFIKENLKEDIEGSLDFDVGYLLNNTVINLRSCTDLLEVWRKLLSGVDITLWCDGLGKSGGKKRRSDYDEDEAPKKKKSEERDERIQELAEDLQSKHGTKYTRMQYRIWSEMVVGGVYKDCDIPPSTTMFKRSGGTFNSAGWKKEDLKQALTQIASAVTPTRSGCSSNSTSPARAIEGRSKCYRQLAELKNLRDSGVLSDEQFEFEREAILATLENLKQ